MHFRRKGEGVERDPSRARTACDNELWTTNIFDHKCYCCVDISFSYGVL
jgi:hypothetical protein